MRDPRVATDSLLVRVRIPAARASTLAGARARGGKGTQRSVTASSPSMGERDDTTSDSSSIVDEQCEPASPSRSRSGQAPSLSKSNERDHGESAEASDPQSPGPSSGKRRKRKAYYVVRKEEKADLTVELRALEEKLAGLRSRWPQRVTREDLATLAHSQMTKDELLELIRAQQRQLGSLQGLLSRHLNAQPTNPLWTFIHLGRDLTMRRATLLALPADKFRQGRAFVHERLGAIDERRPYCAQEHWEDDIGNRHLSSIEILHFEGVSVRDVYEALLYYLSHMELSISVALGDITLREDIDAIGEHVTNHRLICSNSNGIVQEVNTVGCAQFVAAGDHRHQDVAIVTADCVDADDLHPYTPRERVRKDITAVITMGSFARRHQDDPSKTTTVVVMKRCAYLTIHRPEFAISEDAWADLRRGIGSWGDVMLQSVHDSLYGSQ